MQRRLVAKHIGRADRIGDEGEQLADRAVAAPGGVQSERVEGAHRWRVRPAREGPVERGDEQTALGYYEAALDAGLSGDTLRKCLLQYGSTLRLLGRYEDSVGALDRALAGWPDSPSVRAFHALGLHAAGRSDGAVGELLALVADAVRTPDVLRYEAALHGNAGYLLGLDAARRAQPGAD